MRALGMFLILYVINILAMVYMFVLYCLSEGEHRAIKKELQEIKKMVGEDK